MQKRMSAIAFALTLLTFLIAGCSGGGGDGADSFTATLTEHDGELTRIGTMTVRGQDYRMDIEQSGQMMFVIVTKAEGVTRVGMVQEKVYLEIPSQNMQSISEDAFQAVLYMDSLGEVRADGSETIGGYECDKFVTSMQGQDVMAKWVARDLGFPIRIVNLMAENKSIELSDIETGGVDDGLFVIPDDYTMMPAPGQDGK